MAFELQQLSMTDVHSKKVRSFNMSQIRSKNTKPEILVRKYLFSKGFRFRIHDKKLLGKPDIILPKYKTIVFVHGCFWHSHTSCKYAVTPKSNTAYWMKKLAKNIERDRLHLEALEKASWKVIIVWECELKRESFESTMTELIIKITA